MPLRSQGNYPKGFSPLNAFQIDETIRAEMQRKKVNSMTLNPSLAIILYSTLITVIAMAKILIEKIAKRLSSFLTPMV